MKVSNVSNIAFKGLTVVYNNAPGKYDYHPFEPKNMVSAQEEYNNMVKFVKANDPAAEIYKRDKVLLSSGETEILKTILDRLQLSIRPGFQLTPCDNKQSNYILRVDG